MVVFNDTPMEEVSGMFFLTLLTSSSLCPHSYGGRFWNVLPHCSLRHPCVLTHFVIPVISLLWRKVLECSSSPCSLRHPCVLTPMEEVSGMFFLTLLTSSSLCPHSLRHPCVLTPMTCLLTHLIVIPDFSLESSHPSHPWLLTPITRVTTHPILSVLTHTHTHRTNPSHLTLSLPSLVLPCSLIPACSHITPTTTHSHESSHTECSHTHRHPWLLTHTTRLTLTHSSPRSLSPHFSECSHPSLVFSHSPSHIECHHTHSHILLTCVTTLSDFTSLVFWESVCSHFHGVVLPPSHHSLLWENLAPTHTPMVSYYHQVITHTHTNPCAPTHFISPPSRYKCITNHLPHSPTHHASITSSSPHHLFLSPITTNRFLSLHTTLLTPPFHSQPSQSSPKSSPISIHTHNDNSRTP